LGQRAGGVEPVHHVGAEQAADQQRAEVAPLVPGAVAHGVDDHLGPVVQVEQQQDDQDGGADQLGGYADVVDTRHQLDAEHVDGGGDRDQDRPQQQGVLGPTLGQVGPGVGGAAEELQLGGDLREHDLPV